MSKKGIGKFVLGASLGAALSLLFAPKEGKALRKDIKCKFDEFMGNVDKLTVKEVKDEFNDKVEEIKKEIEDLDKEKVLKIAKTKSESIKEKADNLVNLAKEKGNAILEKSATEVRENAISVTKKVLDKLESAEK